MMLRKTTNENIVEKGENTGNCQFLLFLYFLPHLSQIEFSFANAFNLEKSTDILRLNLVPYLYNKNMESSKLKALADNNSTGSNDKIYL